MNASAGTFTPYSGTTLDAPFLHVLLQPLLPLMRPCLALIYSLRWQLSRPLQTRLLPKWFPALKFPLLKSLPFLTYGEIVLAAPLAILIIAGYYYTVVAPDVETSGEMASFAIYSTFLTANKTNSIAAFLLGIPFERMIPFHLLCAWTTVVLAFMHGYVAYAYSGGADDGGGTDGSFLGLGGNSRGSEQDSSSSEDPFFDDRRLDSGDSEFSRNGTNPNFFRFLFDDTNNTSGSILVLSILLLVLSSTFPAFRRRFFDFWLWMHVLLAICVVIFCTMHEVEAILLVAGWWVLDLLMRYLVMAGCLYPHRAKLELVTSDVVKISFPKPARFQYNAGQFAQIALPDLGALAFHPISISSAPHEPHVTFHVRAIGNWSKQLSRLAKQKPEVPILVEGPYGSLSMDVDDDSRYQMTLLVGGGIGVTHCASVAKGLLHDHRIGRQLKHLHFVWAVRDLDIVNILDPVRGIPALGAMETAELSSHSCEVEDRQGQKRTHTVARSDIYLTRSSPGSSIADEHGRVIHFQRPNLKKIVAETKAKARALGGSHVAVFGCGPKVVVETLQEECRKQSQPLLQCGGVTFDVHEEIFLF